MQALLLAAGLGSRLRPLTEKLPKCLVPIQGKPLLGIWLKFLADAGVDRIFINVHYQAELVKRFISESGYADRVIVLDEDELLGTAGTVIRYREQFSRESLLVVHADNLSVFSFQRFYQFHLCHQPDRSLSMMTFMTDDPQSCGIVEVDNDNKLLAFHEKVDNPPGNHANAAIYWLGYKMIANLDASLTDFSTEVIPKNIGNIWCWHNDDYHRDIGNIDSLSQAQHDFPGKAVGPVTDAWLAVWKAVRADFPMLS